MLPSSSIRGGNGCDMFVTSGRHCANPQAGQILAPQAITATIPEANSIAINKEGKLDSPFI